MGMARLTAGRSQRERERQARRRLVGDGTGSNKERRPKSSGPPQPARLPEEPN